MRIAFGELSAQAVQMNQSAALLDLVKIRALQSPVFSRVHPLQARGISVRAKLPFRSSICSNLWSRLSYWHNRLHGRGGPVSLDLGDQQLIALSFGTVPATSEELRGWNEQHSAAVRSGHSSSRQLSTCQKRAYENRARTGWRRRLLSHLPPARPRRAQTWCHLAGRGR